MHKATYHENELLDMALATENRATRLRKAIEHNRLVREQSRAGNAPEPEPPCPEEEKPKTVSIQTLGNFTVEFAAITSITAAWDDGRACLRVIGDGNSMTHVSTTMPLADIQRQAAEAGIELPEVTVMPHPEWTFSSIERVESRCDSAGTYMALYGTTVRSGEKREQDGYIRFRFAPAHVLVPVDRNLPTIRLPFRFTPAQVCKLCELAGWPKPEVTMVCTYADGDPCEVDPENIFGVGVARHATTIETNTPLADGYCVRFVREPVPVVRRMVDACKESE
ncbi:MAG: hypothetical protein WC977_07675 [Anaerovoracaceae bacterium]|jgi:hypothetical protein